MENFELGGQKCKLRCPKCSGQNFYLAEMWDGNGIHFTVKNGVMPFEADTHFAGSPARVVSTCTDCNNQWAVRGAKSVRELVTQEKPKKSTNNVI
jgi:hypothetical protein